MFTQGATQPTFMRAIPVILTASVCDTLLILLAVMGVSLLVLNLVWLKTLLFVLGFLFLSYMGWVTWRSAYVKPDKEEPEALSPKKQIILAASVSLLNPHAILDTIGVIGTSSLSYGGSAIWAFTGACILVSWIWFLGLAAAGRMLGNMDEEGQWTRLLNKFSAFIIWGAAVYMVSQLCY